MNTWENTVVTSKGLALLAKLIEGNTLNITKAVAGSGYVTPGILQNQTAVKSPVQNLRLRSVSYPEDGKCELKVYLSNEGLSSGYTANQVGVYANDPDEGEILFFIAQSVSSSKGTEVPSETESPGFTAEWTFYLKHSQATNVTIVVDPANSVTRGEMEVYVGEYVENALDPLHPTKKVNGPTVAVSDSADAPFPAINIYGKSEQIATNGYQLFKYNATEFATKSKGGATITNHGDGSFTVSGSGTLTEGVSYYHYYTHAESVKLFKTGKLYLKHTGTITTPKIYIHPQVNSTSLTTLTPGNNTEFELTEEMLNDETFRVVIGLYGNSGEKIVPGTFSIMLYQDGDGTLESFSDGVASPSPEYPQEIVNIGDVGGIEVIAYGKNLFDKSKATLNARVSGENGTFSEATFTGCGYSDYIKIYGCKNIFISGDVPQIETDHRIAFYSKDKTFVRGIRGNAPNVTLQNACYDVPEDAYYVVFNFAKAAIDTIQLEIGDKATSYEAYKSSQTLAISTPNGLAGIPVSSGGNYTDENGQEWICDEVDLERGVYVKRTNTADLGELEWYYNEPYAVFTAPVQDLNPDTLVILCTHYLTSTMNSASSPDLTIYGRKDSYGIGGLGVKNSNYTDATTFKAAMAGAIVLYELKTPIETALTDEEIAAFKALTSYKPNTTVLNDSGADMHVEYVTETHDGLVRMLMSMIGNINTILESINGGE